MIALIKSWYVIDGETCGYSARTIYYLFIIESCTEHKQNIVNIMVQRSAPSNK